MVNEFKENQGVNVQKKATRNDKKPLDGDGSRLESVIESFQGC